MWPTSADGIGTKLATRSIYGIHGALLADAHILQASVPVDELCVGIGEPEHRRHGDQLLRPVAEDEPVTEAVGESIDVQVVLANCQHHLVVAGSD